MALWSEKQLQVAKEEMRIKESLAKLHRKQSRKSAKDMEMEDKVRLLLELFYVTTCT